MHAFNDSAGRTWVIELNYGTIVRVHKETSLNLRELVDGDDKNPLEAVFLFVSDPLQFGPALCSILAPAMKDKGITVEQFMETLDGNAGFAAGQAFVRAYINFFHPSKKEALHELIDKSALITTKAVEMARKKLGQINLDEIVTKVSKDIDANLANLSTTSPGSAPASSDSTPGHSLSASL